MRRQKDLPAEARQLLDEIRQIMAQYEDEVAGSGRRWPKSVKERIWRLAELKIPKHRISTETGIPRATVYAWFRQSKKQSSHETPHFVQLPAVRPIQPSPSLVARLDLDGPTPAKPHDILVRLPSGIEIQGLNLEEVIRLHREVSLS